MSPLRKALVAAIVAAASALGINFATDGAVSGVLDSLSGVEASAPAPQE